MFEPEAYEWAAEIAAEEAKSQGISWTIAPMLDIARDARWGRISESPEKTPILQEFMGKRWLRAFQKKNLHPA